MLAQKQYLRCRSYVVIPDQLNVQTLSSLIVSGIQFFLYQRGQLPVPFDDLHLLNSEAITSPAPKNSLYTTVQIPEEIDNPKQRLRFLQHRENICRQKQDTKRRKAEILSEVKARITLESTFKRLVDLFVSFASYDEGIDLVVVLLLGTNPCNAKEIIIFKVNSNKASQAYQTVYAEYDEVELVKLSKRFYKSVIMSEDFGEFVSKKLGKCRSYLNLMTRRPLSQDTVTHYSLTYLESFCLPHLEVERNKDLSLSAHQRFRIKPNVFQINLSTNNLDTKHLEISGGEFSNYYSYGIPMSFKGIGKGCC